MVNTDEVLELRAQGLTPTQIARQLRCSRAAVYWHLNGRQHNRPEQWVQRALLANLHRRKRQIIGRIFHVNQQIERLTDGQAT